jgi:hypothetical protein
MNTNTDSQISTDVLGDIISFLDITEDKYVLTVCKQLFKLTDNENNQILRTWENNSKYEIKEIYGRKEWWVNGKKHRDDDLPAIEFSNGSKYWYVNGKRHRGDDKPAVESKDDDVKIWYVNDKLHRDNNMPAVEFSNGYKEWWVNGTLIRSTHSVEN